MGNDGAVADKDNGRNGASLDGLPTAVIHLTRLVVYPFGAYPRPLPKGGEINRAAVAALHEGSHEYLGTEHVFILNKPCTWVFGEFHQQGTYHRQTAQRAVLGLGIDVRHQLIFHLGSLTERLDEALADEPRLCRRCAMGTGVTRQETEGQPTAVNVLW